MAGTPRQYWIPSRLFTEQLNDSKIELLIIFTMGIGPDCHVIGSILDPEDQTSRLEVCLVVSHRAGEPDVVYLTKYRGQQVGERSVGLHPDIADDVAAMLRAAASLARTQQPETTLDQNVDTR